MTEQRHRQVAFPSPFGLDTEKELWVPRRDRIFVPSNYTTSTWSTREMEAQMRYYYELELKRQERMYERMLFDRTCTPSRQEMLRVPMTWRDIERSERPAWRNRYYGRND